MSDEKQPINIYGGYNSIAPSANTANQTVNSPIGQDPVSTTQSNSQFSTHPLSLNSQPSTLNCQLFVKHDTIGVPQLLRQARQHIVFHAAYYPKYAVDSQSEDVKEALRQHPDLTLTVIHTDIEHASWADEFAYSLRTSFKTKEDFEPYLNISRKFFADLQKEYGPSRVQLYNTARLPFFPVILIDDTLVIGHYAHSRIIPPHGLWLTIQHPSIPVMYATLLLGRTPVCHTGDEEVLLHYLEELVPQLHPNDNEQTQGKQNKEVKTKEHPQSIVKTASALPELPEVFNQEFRNNDVAVVKFFELLYKAGPHISRPRNYSVSVSAERFSSWKWPDLRVALIYLGLLSGESTCKTFSEFIHSVFPNRSQESVYRSLCRNNQLTNRKIVFKIIDFFRPVTNNMIFKKYPIKIGSSQNPF